MKCYCGVEVSTYHRACLEDMRGDPHHGKEAQAQLAQAYNSLRGSVRAVPDYKGFGEACAEILRHEETVLGLPLIDHDVRVSRAVQQAARLHHIPREPEK